MYDYDADDGYEPLTHAFCDSYALHERHVYRAVNGSTYDCPGFDAEDRAELLEREAQPPCEHGLSAWLCAGPSHYPMDA